METERLRWFFNGMYQAGKGYGKAYLIAAGIESVINNATVLIQEGETIVGHNYGIQDYYCGGRGFPVLDDMVKRGLVTPEETVELRSLYQSACDIYNWGAPPIVEKELADIYKDGGIGGWGIVADNHTVLGYEAVLQLGFEGLFTKVKRYEEQNGKSEWYESLKLVCRAGCNLGLRYAQETERLAKTALDDNSMKRYEGIAAVCRNVPRKPAANFREAVQSLWFAHMLNTWEDGINANSLGRLNQILYPYYKADIAKGSITKQKAFDLTCALWIKLYRDYDVQQSCIGGCDAKGNEAINDLSWLMLDATEACDFIRYLSVRYDENTDPLFLRRALEVVGRLQKGIPFFFNDSVLIPALTAKGISLEDARDYTQIGCVETVIPGKSNPHPVASLANLLKSIEYVLFSEDVPDTFDAFKDAVFRHVKRIIDSAYRYTLAFIPYAESNNPKPYKSLLTEGCIESGKDYNAQGAKYDFYQMFFLGIPNLADSLAAVRKLVFHEKKYTLEALIDQLRHNWSDEAIRLDFLNKAPKYGNDQDDVDDIAAEIMEVGCDYLNEISQAYGYDFHAQPFTFIWMIDFGKATAATPDGRRKGEVMAYSVSPMQGRDFSGLTALFNSLTKLPTKKAAGSTSAIIEVDPQLFSEKNLQYLMVIMQEAARYGLCNAQFNVVNVQTLEDAQINPENHRNLAVRVSGFSQKFNQLDKAMQNHIISRAKHKNL